jgi:hypothetical protein
MVDDYNIKFKFKNINWKKIGDVIKRGEIHTNSYHIIKLIFN